ncbi:MAG: hypothetical protein AW09_004481 [Candidatus Accumulibacter phosphatis]|jgi:hypothetical protein|uniref:Uncharacterized protein n=1 Tax=Candidatus Accumulibacter phosphatis TaxID=327160 RepID=A0A084Y6T1_9PROT|nr:MAG: hypothetical protein AW09_004481 [Candidatus Accumulibacter phosphatis]
MPLISCDETFDTMALAIRLGAQPKMLAKVLEMLELMVRIPRQTGHRFHSKLDSDSTPNWTAIPGQTGQSFVLA